MRAGLCRDPRCQYAAQQGGRQQLAPQFNKQQCFFRQSVANAVKFFGKPNTDPAQVGDLSQMGAGETRCICGGAGQLLDGEFMRQKARCGIDDLLLFLRREQIHNRVISGRWQADLQRSAAAAGCT